MKEFAPIEGRQGERTDFQSTFLQIRWWILFKLNLEEIFSFLFKIEHFWFAEWSFTQIRCKRSGGPCLQPKQYPCFPHQSKKKKDGVQWSVGEKSYLVKSGERFLPHILLHSPTILIALNPKYVVWTFFAQMLLIRYSIKNKQGWKT